MGVANISADPLFLNAASATPFNHLLSLHTCSPANNSGDDFGILDDYTDINDAAPDPNDPNWVTWDHEKYLRRIPATTGINTVDMGAFETCLGDLDGDFDVEIDDLSDLLTCFGATCAETPSCCFADIQNCDGTVDLSDLSQLLSNFGATCVAPLQSCPGEGFAPPGGGEGGGEDELSDYDFPPSDDPLTQWLRTRTLEELLDWYRDGMPQ